MFLLSPSQANAVPGDLKEKSPVEVSKPLSIDEKVALVFPDAPIMLKIAYCESGNGCHGPIIDPTAKNPSSTASGVFQILKGTWKAYGCTGDVFNEDDNIACARKIYDDSGTTPWDASRGGWK